MVQFIQAQNVGLAYLEERFGLQLAEEEAFFIEWFENLPEITDLEKQEFRQSKTSFSPFSQASSFVRRNSEIGSFISFTQFSWIL